MRLAKRTHSAGECPKRSPASAFSSTARVRRLTSWAAISSPAGSVTWSDSRVTGAAISRCMPACVTKQSIRDRRGLLRRGRLAQVRLPRLTGRRAGEDPASSGRGRRPALDGGGRPPDRDRRRGDPPATPLRLSGEERGTEGGRRFLRRHREPRHLRGGSLRSDPCPGYRPPDRLLDLHRWEPGRSGLLRGPRGRRGGQRLRLG